MMWVLSQVDVHELLCYVAFQGIQVLLLRLFSHPAAQTTFHICYPASNILLKLAKFLLRELLQVELITLTAFEHDGPHTLQVLFSQALNGSCQFTLFLEGHRLGVIELAGEGWLLFFLLLGLWRRLRRSLVGLRFGFSRDAVVVLLELIGDLDEVFIGSIEQVAIVEDLHHVLVELLWGGVSADSQLSFDGLQVHWFTHYLAVFGDVKCLYVDWLYEGQCAFVLLQQLQSLQAWLHCLVHALLLTHYYLLGYNCRRRWREGGGWFGLEVHSSSQQQFLGSLLLDRRFLLLLARIDVERIALGQEGGKRLCLLYRQLNAEHLSRHELSRKGGSGMVVHVQSNNI